MSAVPNQTGYGFVYNKRKSTRNTRHQNKEVTVQTKYDLQALEALPIDEVVEYYGAEPIGNGRKYYKCFNDHTKGKAKITIYEDKNICKCHNCNEVQGNPIAVAKFVHNGDFKAACEDLHDAFNVPFLNGDQKPPSAPRQRREFKQPEIDYWRYDDQKPYAEIDVNKFLPIYEKLTDEQKLKMVYTAVYRFSKKTDHHEKLYYYTSRKIEDNHYLNEIGWLSPTDIKELCKRLEKAFPIEDLVRFKLYGDNDAKRPYQWKYFTKNGFTVVPSYDLYSNMVNGLMLRQTDFDTKGPKEFQVTYNDISIALPFAVTPQLLRKKNTPIFICEGHIDGLSLDKPFVSFPGIYGYKDEWLGLFEDRIVIIAFDQDKPAKESIFGKDEHIGLKQKLYDAGAKFVKVLQWDETLGEDLNDLLKNSHLHEVLTTLKQGVKNA